MRARDRSSEPDDSEPNDEPIVSTNIDELLETWPVNDPSAVAEVVLAKTRRLSIHIA